MSQENVEIVRGVRYRISLPSERASRRRSLDERFFVRIPGLYRLLADRLMRLPPLSQHRLRHRPRKYLARADVSVGQRQQILRARYLDRLLDRRGSAQQAEPASVSKRLLSHQEQHPQPR